jgi:hypothetical protein
MQIKEKSSAEQKSELSDGCAKEFNESIFATFESFSI